MRADAARKNPRATQKNQREEREEGEDRARRASKSLRRGERTPSHTEAIEGGSQRISPPIFIFHSVAIAEDPAGAAGAGGARFGFSRGPGLPTLQE